MSLLGVIAALVGYLVGAVSPATVVAGRRGVDLRTVGSGNPGTSEPSTGQAVSTPRSRHLPRP